MSMVYRCDRCGKFFDTKNLQVITKRYSAFGTYDRYDPNNAMYLDLCKECTDDFDKFMTSNNKKTIDEMNESFYDQVMKSAKKAINREYYYDTMKTTKIDTDDVFHEGPLDHLKESNTDDIFHEGPLDHLRGGDTDGDKYFE